MNKEVKVLKMEKEVIESENKQKKASELYGYYLDGGKETYIRRYEIMGAIKTEKLPEWANKHINKIMKDKSMEERNWKNEQ